MIRYIIICFFIISCKPNRPEKLKSVDGVTFEFVAKHGDKSKEFSIIEIEASLINHNSDTCYFLTSTCDGIQYSIKYDTTHFQINPFILCNASYPQIEKIAPNSKLDFKTYFKTGVEATTIELAFDLYKVDKSFDLKHAEWANIYHRPASEQCLIWADEEKIK